jgi:DNA repair protein RadC
LALIHNHPDGDPSPSDADRMHTQTLAAAGRLFDIAVHDYVIISRDDS